MHDLLVPLYRLPEAPPVPSGILIRQVFQAELKTATEWVRQEFSDGWATEFSYAANLSPSAAYIALSNEAIIGFACFDAAAKGVFGPTGVAEAGRGRGVGTALLFRVMTDMRAAGYAYAVIGAAGPIEYYERVVGAARIDGGAPGFLGSLVKKPKE
ncbi:GNAT family N-acetyltransferase [Hyphococcus sp. DH-69]|uniref:GNAT family N-acetyltransferase n=1 Tax=Hyphococcus formosus TaxID=3143534 RepID=UPI00398B0A56